MKSVISLYFAVLIILLGSSCESGSNGIYNITRFGAIGDGKAINTKAINKAIDKCHSDGGGAVLVPQGKFITGTIILKSNVTLRVEAGGILFGSSDTSDYLKMESAQFSEGYNRYGLIFAKEAVNISITGQGEINGNGTVFMSGIDKPHMGGYDFDRAVTRQGENFMREGEIFEDGPVSYDYRPAMIMTIESCERIRVSDITFRDSPEWTMRIGECDDVEINGISIINNKLIPNSDGIHCTTSRNVRISNCNVFAGDDAIIVTGFGYRPVPGENDEELMKSTGNKTGYAENVTVTNCILSSRSACIRVGYGNHPIRNLTFSNLIMYDSNRGIGIFARDNSRIENVLFSDIVINNRLHSGHWWGKGEPIHISAIQDTKNGKAGSIKNIRFRNITAFSETGILIYGTENSVLEDIQLNKVSITINRGKYTDSYGGNFDLRPAWPKDKAIFRHDIPGIYAGFVKNLKVSDIEINWGNDLPEWFTAGIELENFKNVIFKDISAGPAHEDRGQAAIVLRDGENPELVNIRTDNRNIPYVMINVKKQK